MAKAIRVPDRSTKDSRDVQLTMTVEEAECLRTLLYTKIGGTGPARNPLNRISNALSATGIYSSSGEYAFEGGVSCK